MSLRESSTIASMLQTVLGEEEVNRVGLLTGQSQRLRVVTPLRLATGLIAALADGTVETIADLCRAFNFMYGSATAYKAYYMRLARPGFVRFMQRMVERLLTGLAVEVIEPDPDTPLSRFEDVLIQDGSSFAVQASLREELDEAGASFVMRLSRSFKPYVRGGHGDDGLMVLTEPVALPEFLDGRVSEPLDLDIELRKGKRRFPCRLVLLPGKEGAGARLCTNLPRDEFPAALVGRLYRFRWQVELLFKEWKSYANLRKFDTGNEHIAEGLFWASLAAAILKRFLGHAPQAATGSPISTRRVAMCAHLFLRALLGALGRLRRLRAVVRRTVAYLADNARRAHPWRDRERGRQSAGFKLRLAA